MFRKATECAGAGCNVDGGYAAVKVTTAAAVEGHEGREC